MNTMTKLAVGVAVIAMAASACSGDASTGADPIASPATEQESSSAATSDGPTSGGGDADLPDLAGVELTVLMHPALLGALGGEEDGGLIHEFESVTGADVVPVTAGIGEHVERALADFSTEAGTFDVINMQNSDVHERLNPFLFDLAPYIEDVDPSWDYEDYPTSLREVVTLDDGQIVGVPFRFGVNMLYYRQDLLDDAGLEAPTTFDEFISVAETLKGAGVEATPVYQRGTSEEIVHDWLGFVYGAGGSLLTDDNSACALDSPEGAAAAQLFADLHSSELLPEDFFAVGRDEYIAAMQQGRAAMGVYYSPYWLNFVDEESTVADQMAWALQPTAPGVEPGTSRAGGWYLTVSKFSRNPDAAWEFIQFVTNPDNALRSAIEWGNGPVRASTYESPEYLEQFPLAEDWLTALEASRTDPSVPEITQIIDTLSPELVAITLGEKDVETGLADACAAIDSILQ